MGGLCLAVVLGLLLPAHAADSRSEPGAAQPFVPSFWNPQAPGDKPDLGARTTLRFVTGNDYPPFHFTLDDGTLTGFNVDLARAVCDELGLTCTIQARAWSNIRAALTDGTADAAIASLSMDERAPDVAFTSPYYKTPARFVARLPAPPVSSLAGDLEGRRIGVQADTAQAAYVSAFFPKASLRSFPTLEALHAALKAGEIDLMFGDAITAALWLGGTEAGGCCAFIGGPYTETRFFGPGAGIAVRKDDPTLRQALDYALARVAAKGIYGDLYLRYFPIGFY